MDLKRVWVACAFGKYHNYFVTPRSDTFVRREDFRVLLFLVISLGTADQAAGVTEMKRDVLATSQQPTGLA